MRRSLLLLPACLAVAALAGCGLKGPLVMPPAKPSSAPTPAVPAPASSALPAPTPGAAMPSAPAAPAPAGTATLPATER